MENQVAFARRTPPRSRCLIWCCSHLAAISFEVIDRGMHTRSAGLPNFKRWYFDKNGKVRLIIVFGEISKVGFLLLGPLNAAFLRAYSMEVYRSSPETFSNASFLTKNSVWKIFSSSCMSGQPYIRVFEYLFLLQRFDGDDPRLELL